MKITGAPQIYDLNPYEQTDQQSHQLGALGIASNGDLYRYTRIISTGTDLVAGKLYTSLSREDNHQNITVAASNSVGDTSVTLDIGGTAVDSDEYNEGFLIFNDNSPEGEWYGIDSHEASTSGSEEVTFNVYPSLQTATTVDSSEASLVRNPWNNPAISQLIAERAAGIPVVDWDVSVANFGWLKTRGLAAAFCDGGITVGYQVTISDATDGAVGLFSDVDAEEPVGQLMDAGVSGEFNPIYLTID